MRWRLRSAVVSVPATGVAAGLHGITRHRLVVGLAALIGVAAVATTVAVVAGDRQRSAGSRREQSQDQDVASVHC